MRKPLFVLATSYLGVQLAEPEFPLWNRERRKETNSAEAHCDRLAGPAAGFAAITAGATQNIHFIHTALTYSSTLSSPLLLAMIPPLLTPFPRREKLRSPTLLARVVDVTKITVCIHCNNIKYLASPIPESITITDSSAATQAIVKPATAAAEMLYLNTVIYQLTTKTTIPAGARNGVILSI
ncbi:hypothetical protein BCON_0019g00740 [Botryotinia convoluta]|uniref:Uncharacterized protein n=1 Tax=Botryotinia convoluta TaxID=54673 RepID=A0A4Z1IM49_9HELO|nr:hypothetical protein BCON_0019g00740 [Botryotinia convoluta]